MTAPLTTGEVDALLERVEAATGADKVLDEALGAAFRYASRDLYEGGNWIPPWWHGLSGSVDKTLALISRVLPGARFTVCSDGDRFSAWVSSGEREVAHYSPARTPALALLAAMLRALRAQSADTPNPGEPT